MSENKSKFNIKYINTNLGHVYYCFAEFFIYFFKTGIICPEENCFSVYSTNRDIHKGHYSGAVKYDDFPSLQFSSSQVAAPASFSLTVASLATDSSASAVAYLIAACVS